VVEMQVEFLFMFLNKTYFVSVMIFLIFFGLNVLIFHDQFKRKALIEIIIRKFLARRILIFSVLFSKTYNLPISFLPWKFLVKVSCQLCIYAITV